MGWATVSHWLILVITLAQCTNGMHRSTLHALLSRRISLARETVAGGGVGECSPLMEKMCQPCGAKSSPDPTWCEQMESECKDMFCSTLCMKQTFICEVKLDSLISQQLGESASEMVNRKHKTEDVICREYIAGACNELDCCPMDEYCIWYGKCTNTCNSKLVDYIENYSFQDEYPQSIFPLKECLHDVLDIQASEVTCKVCKSKAASIKPSIKIKPCTFPETDTAPAALIELESGDNTRWTGNSFSIPFRVHETDPIRFQSRSAESSTPPPILLPGLPTHSTLAERCEALHEVASSKIAAWIENIPNLVCNCGGCCDEALGDCHIPVITVNKT